MSKFHLPHRNVTRVLLLASALALGGCVVAPERDYRYRSEEMVYGPTTSIYVQVAPPAPRVEYRGYPPVAGYVWITGYWSWGGARYVWVPGRWVAPRPGYIWVPHRWDRDGDRWRHDGGRWEPERRSDSRRDSDRDHDHDREQRREYDRQRDAEPWRQPQPQLRMQNEPQRVDPRPVPDRSRDGDERRDNERWRQPGTSAERIQRPDPRQNGGRAEAQRQHEPRAAPRPEMQGPSERSLRDPRDPHRREREEEWRKEREKDKDKERQD
ncbi:MAG TPA: YXWGXW repeat-containing protein [Burkholderiaceae bacterium]|nr:YXWGXW repeat-containing protein [Burkholderiaceae bacterium]